MSVKLHLFTGKGGVGKSTLAARKAIELSQAGQKSVLLVETYRPGYAEQVLDITAAKFAATASKRFPSVSLCLLNTKETMEEYLLTHTSSDVLSSIGLSTNKFRKRFIRKFLDNKLIRNFIDFCPGIEPTILIGKLVWESEKTLDNKELWDHVVVDMPASGHALQFFKSLATINKVFPIGPIQKQSKHLLEFLCDNSKCHINIVTLAEELPLQESIELIREFDAIGYSTHSVLINKYDPQSAILDDEIEVFNQDWQKALKAEQENLTQQRSDVNEFIAKLNSIPCWSLPSIPFIKILNDIRSLKTPLKKLASSDHVDADTGVNIDA